MKAVIKNVEKVNGDLFFKVYSVNENGNEENLATFYYKKNMPDDNPMNEQKNLEAAKEVAARIEAWQGTEKEEIIYKTPEPEKPFNDIFNAISKITKP